MLADKRSTEIEFRYSLSVTEQRRSWTPRQIGRHVDGTTGSKRRPVGDSLKDFIA
jgi:hypothetical protein